MTLRVGFDMDGVVADFASAFRDIERDLFGADTLWTRPSIATGRGTGTNAGPKPEPGCQRERAANAVVAPIWDRIRATPDFWTTLKPTDPGAVRQAARDRSLRCRVGSSVHYPATVDGR